MGSAAGLLIATELGSAGDGPASAAALAVAVARGPGEDAVGEADARGAIVAELGATARRRPTLLSSAVARGLEDRVSAAGFARPAARGRICWVGLAREEGWDERLEALVASVPGSVVVLHAPPVEWRHALDSPELRVEGALVRADVRPHRSLLALCVAELLERSIPVRVATRGLGLVGSRRALAGLDPGGPTSARMARAARGLLAG